MGQVLDGRVTAQVGCLLHVLEALRTRIEHAPPRVAAQ
jgi:hypothetical protein